MLQCIVLERARGRKKFCHNDTLNSEAFRGESAHVVVSGRLISARFFRELSQGVWIGVCWWRDRNNRPLAFQRQLRKGSKGHDSHTGEKVIARSRNHQPPPTSDSNFEAANGWRHYFPPTVPGCPTWPFQRIKSIPCSSLKKNSTSVVKEMQMFARTKMATEDAVVVRRNLAGSKAQVKHTSMQTNLCRSKTSPCTLCRTFTSGLRKA